MNKKVFLTIKRVFDTGTAAAGGIVALPVMLGTMAVIHFNSPEDPVIFRQKRVGYKQEEFTIYKFRTMTNEKDADGNLLPDSVRLKNWGRVIRKLSIDELPQIICVLKGDMSMVGPRPERAVFIGKLREQIPFYISRLKMKPGLTGWAQVRHHYDTSIEDVQIKLQYDMYYYENMSLLLDFQILVRTVYVVLTGKGAQ